MVLLQDGDNIVVAEVHSLIPRRVAPPAEEEDAAMSKSTGGAYAAWLTNCMQNQMHQIS